MRRMLLVVSLLIGCGSSASQTVAPDAGAADARANDVCARRANALCAGYDKCDSYTPLTRWYGSASDCVAQETHLCERDRSLAGVVDADAQLEACVTALAARAACPAIATPLFCAAARPAGTLAEGSSCLLDEQCGSALCVASGGAFDADLLRYPGCGRCARRLAVGDACTFGKNECDPLSSTLRSTGLTCDRATSRCVTRPATGLPCKDGSDCDNGVCFDGYCGGNGNVVTGPALLAVGAECAAFGGPKCGGGSWCKGANEVSPGACSATLGLGERCTSSSACGHVNACAPSPDDGWMRCLDAQPRCGP